VNVTPAVSLAHDLMSLHGLVPQGWRFAFDHARKRAGCCKYGRKLITLSRHFVAMNDEATVRETLLHEIAHALTPGAHHGPAWYAKAREIGSNGRRLYGEETAMPAGKWAATCLRCKRVVRRHKRPMRGRTYAHRGCGGTFEWAYTPADVEQGVA
jgi:hypothetical protein